MDMNQRYAQRLKRYITALRNEKPDRIPIRPFVAEFTAKYAGYACQEVTHDYTKAFDAACKCAADFDWDATVPNMVYVWTGLTEAIGLKYYGVPGIHVPPDTGFQYREPSEENAFMRADEYDALIDDPTSFLFNVWLPRVSADVQAPGEPNSYRNNLSFLKGGMAMLSYFTAFGPQIARLRDECGTVSAIAGIFKAPFDIIADKLRGYIGLTLDLIHQPKKVLAACEALMPHLLHMALSGADPDRNVPIGFWMHRGCTPFISRDHFHTLYWPTLKPIIEEIWARGHQVLFYAEGNWNDHLESFAELPDKSIVFHIDRSDPFLAHRVLGHKFCLSGGVPNYLLSYGTPDEVRAYCKTLIDGVARDGGYVMDASAIVQNDARVENVRAMTDFTREYGNYDGAAYRIEGNLAEPTPRRSPAWIDRSRIAPGVCIPWDDKRRELPDLTGDEQLVRKIWEDLDALGNLYIWHCLLSF
ncbi:MAG: hypothetical protein HY706_11225 [Candidatus Hydrogenedentes bacterium]|nr:hypothetical protein [Candidatus Hydrogenedentota bacterium]